MNICTSGPCQLEANVLLHFLIFFCSEHPMSTVGIKTDKRKGKSSVIKK